jgi:exonuclease SbcC
MYCTLEVRGALVPMIPKRISLTNFLSYRDVSLDFNGLHVACIAGPNGAGKSSLLEAIGWAIWGQSRVATDDDVIHQGEMEARVAFVFQQGDHCYRIIRCRHRIQGTALEFQVETEAGYRVLTQRGVRATQQLICRHLKLDYDTFVNSAYLRQGRADDFMLKRPSDRKQILADLLKLDHYDCLAEKAREQLRQAKAEFVVRQSQIDEITTQLERYDSTLQTYAQLQQDLQQLEHQQETVQQQRAQFRHQEADYRNHQQQWQLKQQQLTHLETLRRQTDEDIDSLKQQIEQSEGILNQIPAIQAGLATLQALESKETSLNQHFQQYQTLQHQQQQLAAAFDEQTQAVRQQLQQSQLQLDNIQAQLTELTPILSQAQDVEAAGRQLAAARNRLRYLDNLQLQAEPLLQRQRQLQGELQQMRTRLQTRLDELQGQVKQLQARRAEQPQLEASAEEVSKTLTYLEQRRTYQEQVREKGLERRSFMEMLQTNQRTYETQLAQVDQKLQLLIHPEAACPLCERALDDHHRALVEERHRQQQQELRDELWVIREQLAVSEREIQVLRQEYRAIEAEMELYAPVLQKQGQLEARLATQSEVQNHIRHLEAEQQQLQRCLEDTSYATDLQAELQQIEQTLAQLAYDDRDHALARGQVDRLRWADIKQHEIKQARLRQQRLMDQKAKLEAAIADLTAKLQRFDQSPLKRQLAEVTAKIATLNYNIEHHQQVREALNAAQTWRMRQQELVQAQQRHPQLLEQLATLKAKRQSQQQELATLTEQMLLLKDYLQRLIYDPDQVTELESTLTSLQQQRDSLLAQLGALNQKRDHQQALQEQLQEKKQELTQVRQRQRVYQELAQAFGRNGIQAMMIENVLPQLEAETNQLLGRLSGHQLHVQFVTQRVSKRRQDKLIDTLDILIADARGTRPYETYSGGEAFRINFAIRLALARLLAQRSGMALQMLIIDEGFGTQDHEGCDRLIAAINAIADDFTCILTVTHIPHFREAFQTRIDVVKTAQGSQLVMST